MTFKDKVITIIQRIPKGKVVSYGQVAAMAGSPRAARQVGGILRHANPGSLPWWRVINNAGRVSIKGNFECTPDIQRQLLRKEGVKVSEDFQINMDMYQSRKRL